MLAEDEEMKRVGRETLRKDGRMRRRTAGHEDGDEDRGAAKEGSKAVESKRGGEEKQGTFEQLTGLVYVLSLSLHARGFTDYAPVDRARSSARYERQR